MKKIFNKATIILTIIFTIGISSIANAATMNDADIAKFLVTIGAIQGYPNGDLGLNNQITREEFSKIIVLASNFKNSVNVTSPSSPFNDVTKERWSAPYIKVAVQNGILKGYPDGTFKPQNNIKLEEAVTIALRMLNYSASEYGTNWPYSQISFAYEKEILNNVSTKANENISRKDAINIIYNVLDSKINGQNIEYITLLGYNKIDDVTIMASKNESAQIESNKILTTNGSYKIASSFDYSSVGSKGSLIIYNDSVISNVSYKQNRQTYPILSVTSNGIVVNNNGSDMTISVKDSTLAYYKTQKFTLREAASLIQKGDVASIYYDVNGNVDYVLIYTPTMEGPYVVRDSSWVINYSIDNSYIITRNDTIVNVSDIQTNDVIYINKNSKQVYVYNKKVFGTIENITPSLQNASAVVIGGKSYNIATTNAFMQLKKFNVGSNITILLGKNDEIVEIIEASNITNTNNFGLLIETGIKQFTDSEGKTYNSYYAKVADISGNVNQYIVNDDLKSLLNKLVNVSISNNKTVISILSTNTSLSGIYDLNSNKIGNNQCASDLQILELAKIDANKYAPKYSVISKQRLNGFNISAGNVLHYTKNQAGNIDKLVILDVTGDMYNFGMVISSTGLSPSNASTIYVYDINGVQRTTTTQNVSYNGIYANTPVKMLIDNSGIINMIKLDKFSSFGYNLTSTSITVNGKVYSIPTNIPVYKKTDVVGSYIYSNLNDTILNKYTNITVYYDKLPENGGSIRMLVVTI